MNRWDEETVTARLKVIRPTEMRDMLIEMSQEIDRLQRRVVELEARLNAPIFHACSLEFPEAKSEAIDCLCGACFVMAEFLSGNYDQINCLECLRRIADGYDAEADRQADDWAKANADAIEQRKRAEEAEAQMRRAQLGWELGQPHQQAALASAIEKARQEERALAAKEMMVVREGAAEAAHAAVMLVYRDAVRAKQVMDAVLEDRTLETLRRTSEPKP